MASATTENYAKTASPARSDGGKQSVRLYAVRPLGRGQAPAPPFTRRRAAGNGTGREKNNTASGKNFLDFCPEAMYTWEAIYTQSVWLHNVS